MTRSVRGQHWRGLLLSMVAAAVACAGLALLGAVALGVASVASPAAGAATPARHHTTKRVVITDPRIPVPTNSSEGAVYMTVRNTGSRPVAIVGASTSPKVAASAMVHKEVLHGQSEVMVPVARLVIGAGKTMALAPGGYHVMLMGLRGTLRVGQEVPITLKLSTGSTMSLRAPVVTLAQAFGHGVAAPSSDGGMAGMQGMHMRG